MEFFLVKKEAKKRMNIPEGYSSIFYMLMKQTAIHLETKVVRYYDKEDLIKLNKTELINVLYKGE